MNYIHQSKKIDLFSPIRNQAVKDKAKFPRGPTDKSALQSVGTIKSFNSLASNFSVSTEDVDSLEDISLE